MARNYTQLSTTIWRNRDFRALTMDAQLVYLMLISQPEITSVGSLSITLKRWAEYAVDESIERLSIAIRELEERRFIVVDHAEEELLVRSFVRWDGGYKIPKRLESIKASAERLNSELLQQVTAYELNALGIAHGLTVEPIDSLSIGIREGIECAGVVVTNVSSSHNPQPTTFNPQPTVKVEEVENLSNARDENEQPPTIYEEARSAPVDLSVMKVVRAYCARVRPSDPNRVAPHVINASADWTLDAISQALEIMAEDKRTVTADTLRIELQSLEIPDKHGIIHYRTGGTKEVATGNLRNKAGVLVGGGGPGTGKSMWRAE